MFSIRVCILAVFPALLAGTLACRCPEETAPPTALPGANNTPALFYACDESKGDAIASPNGLFPGKLEGCNWMAGKINTGLRLNGCKDNVRLGPVPIPGGDFTLAAWVRPASVVECSYRVLASRERLSVEGGRFRLYLASQNRLGFYASAQAGAETETLEAETAARPVAREGEARLETGRQTVPVNTWTHVAVTRAGGKYTLYLNGAAAAETACTSSTWFDPGDDVDMRLGACVNRRGAGPSRAFNGWIDEVRLEPRAWEAADFARELERTRATGWLSAMNWNPALVLTTWKSIYIDLTAFCARPGTYELLFEQTAGDNPLEMRFLQAGSQAAGYALSAGPTERQFTLRVEPGASMPIALTAELRGSGSNDSFGDVLVRRVQSGN